MNFYKHHIGDYDSHTAHLTWLEDMAYTRLMRLYYRREGPIPEDIAQACRLVRATTKQEREAVQSVLNEFFELRDDGWHSARCDEEILAYKAKADKNRQVGKTGGRPRKKETMMVSEKNHDGFFSEPSNNPNQKPETRSQINREPSSYSELESTRPRFDDDCPDSKKVVATGPPSWMSWFNAEYGLQLDPVSARDRKIFWPLAQRWCSAGVTFEQMRKAIVKAQAEANEPIAYLPAYADRVLISMTAPPPQWTGRQAAISNYAAQAAQARGEIIDRTTPKVLDITGESVRVA